MASPSIAPSVEGAGVHLCHENTTAHVAHILENSGPLLFSRSRQVNHSACSFGSANWPRLLMRKSRNDVSQMAVSNHVLSVLEERVVPQALGAVVSLLVDVLPQVGVGAVEP